MESSLSGIVPSWVGTMQSGAPGGGRGAHWGACARVRAGGGSDKRSSVDFQRPELPRPDLYDDAGLLEGRVTRPGLRPRYGRRDPLPAPVDRGGPRAPPPASDNLRRVRTWPSRGRTARQPPGALVAWRTRDAAAKRRRQLTRSGERRRQLTRSGERRRYRDARPTAPAGRRRDRRPRAARSDGRGFWGSWPRVPPSGWHGSGWASCGSAVSSARRTGSRRRRRGGSSWRGSGCRPPSFSRRMFGCPAVSGCSVRPWCCRPPSIGSRRRSSADDATAGERVQRVSELQERLAELNERLAGQ